MYSKCKRMVGLLLICVLALGVSAAAFETQIEPRDNWHDYTGELPADTGDVGERIPAHSEPDIRTGRAHGQSPPST